MVRSASSPDRDRHPYWPLEGLLTTVPAVISLSVVVPATDEPPTLSRCRDAIAASDHPAEEVIVVDAPSTLSASAARNAGAERATGDVIVFVDADVEVHRDAFTRIRAAFDRDPKLAAVFGAYDDTPDDDGTVSAFRNLLHHHVHVSGAGPAETFWTGLGAVRRTSFADVGGFDEARYPHPSVEDIDLGQRLRARGERITLDPTIQGTHLKVWTLRSMVTTDFLRRGIPWVALQVRRRQVSRALNCGWRHRVSAIATTAALGALVLWWPALLVAAVSALVWLNRRFYLLLAVRLGPPRAVAGVALHGLHHLVSIAAVPFGLAVALTARAGPSPVQQPSVPSIAPLITLEEPAA
ncbi:MAG: glycosyltransferase family 2 protein [Actinobacteria bacterium]|nr:MAG: glycosyltransferase family 2 protein [Actinomycetota bacterium]